MKKLLLIVSMVALTVFAFGMAKAPEKADVCSMEKAIKDAGCCGSADCGKTASSCGAEKTTCAVKDAAEKTTCSGGTCPLSK